MVTLQQSSPTGDAETSNVSKWLSVIEKCEQDPSRFTNLQNDLLQVPRNNRTAVGRVVDIFTTAIRRNMEQGEWGLVDTLTERVKNQFSQILVHDKTSDAYNAGVTVVRVRLEEALTTDHVEGAIAQKKILQKLLPNERCEIDPDRLMGALFRASFRTALIKRKRDGSIHIYYYEQIGRLKNEFNAKLIALQEGGELAGQSQILSNDDFDSMCQRYVTDKLYTE